MTKRCNVINNRCSTTWNVLVLVSIEHPLDVATPAVLAGAARVSFGLFQAKGGAIFANNNAAANGGEETRGTRMVRIIVRITTTVSLRVMVRP